MLKVNYKNDVFEGKRKYNKIDNSDGTLSLADVTSYTQEGDKFGGSDINASNAAIMGFEQKTTVFNADGSITATDAVGRTMTTVFSTDGSTITETYKDENGLLLGTHTITFGTDGSITESVQIES